MANRKFHVRTQAFWVLLTALAVMFHLAFLILHVAPVDYTTFMQIGDKWLAGEPIYTGNSYYPLPMVALFAAVAALPTKLGYLTWIGSKLVGAVAFSGAMSILAFSPLVSGQSSWVAMFGFWGYRRFPNQFIGGLALALITLKPQLAFVPLAWALWQWCKRRELRSFAGFILTCGLIYGVSFLVYPHWVIDWLSDPRQLRPRAMTALASRLALNLGFPSWVAWLVALMVAVVLLVILYRRRALSLDTLIVWSFVVSPLMHNYDLIQFIPALDAKLRKVAILASLPGWITILFFYNNDYAWITFTVIAPIILTAMARQR